MPGHLGVDRITIQNLEIIDVDKEKNIIIVRGSVPGHKNGFIMLKEALKRPKGYVRKKIVIEGKKKSVKATVKK